MTDITPSPAMTVLFKELQRLLGVSVMNGQIRLNFNEGRVQSFETRTFGRVAKAAVNGNRREHEA